MEETIEKNRRGEIDYPLELWKNVSSQAWDLVIKMTERDQYKRLSAKECLEHAWFSNIHFADKCLTDVIINLKNFGSDHMTQADHNRECSRKLGLNTSSPMFMKRTLPARSSLPSASNLPVVESDFFDTSRKGEKTPKNYSQSFLMSIVKTKLGGKGKPMPTKSDNALNQLVVNPFLPATLPAYEEEDEKLELSQRKVEPSSEGSEDEIPSEREPLPVAASGRGVAEPVQSPEEETKVPPQIRINPIQSVLGKVAPPKRESVQVLSHNPLHPKVIQIDPEDDFVRPPIVRVKGEKRSASSDVIAARSVRSLPQIVSVLGASKKLLENSRRFAKVISTSMACVARDGVGGSRKLNKSFIMGSGGIEKNNNNNNKTAGLITSVTDFAIGHRTSMKDTKDTERTPRAETMPRKSKLNAEKSGPQTHIS